MGNREKERVLFFVGFCYNKFTFSCSRYFSHSYIFFYLVRSVVASFIICRCFWSFLLLLLLLLLSSSLLLSKLFTRFIYFETLSIHYNESLLHNAHTHFSLSFSPSHIHLCTQMEHSFQFVQLLFVCYNCAHVCMHVHVPKRKYHLKIVQSHAFKVFIFIVISLSLSLPLF